VPITLALPVVAAVPSHSIDIMSPREKAAVGC